MSKTIFIKAQGSFIKGEKPASVWLDRDSVEKALSIGAKDGDRITVKVKVGKKRKLIKAYLMAEYERCCDDHAHVLLGYRAEK